jgi:hypothetical protein
MPARNLLDTRARTQRIRDNHRAEHIVMRPATLSHDLYSLACLASCGSHSGCLIAVRSHASREPTWLNHRKTVVTG